MDWLFLYTYRWDTIDAKWQILQIGSFITMESKRIFDNTNFALSYTTIYFAPKLITSAHCPA
jgi:hypothetical protein